MYIITQASEKTANLAPTTESKDGRQVAKDYKELLVQRGKAGGDLARTTYLEKFPPFFYSRRTKKAGWCYAKCDGG